MFICLAEGLRCAGGGSACQWLIGLNFWCNQAASTVLVADVIDRKEVERMQFLSQGPLQKALLVRNCLSDSSHSHCSTSAVLQDQWDFSVCSIILGRGYSEKLK